MDKMSFSPVYYENYANFYSIRRGEPDPVERISHQIDCYEVCFVLKGSINHQRGQESVILEPGDCYIVPPGSSHSVSESSEDAECFWLSFQEESLFFQDYRHNNLYRFFGALGLDSDGKAGGVQMCIKLPEKEKESISRLFECLLYECTEVPEDQRNAESLLIAIMGIIARNYLNSPFMEQELIQVDKYGEIIKDCIKYIDENYMMPLSISHMAKEFALSPSSFSIMFPKVAGVPFKQYLNRKRINAAMALCADQGMPFQQIAGMCGYQDVSTFYRNFIKVTGVSPTSYRENMKK